MCGWDNAPKPIKEQIGRLLRAIIGTLGEDLIGLYLYGSLAAGCFNPERSDIDLLAVTRRRMTAEERRRVIETLLALSRSPRGAFERGVEEVGRRGAEGRGSGRSDRGPLRRGPRPPRAAPRRGFPDRPQRGYHQIDVERLGMGAGEGRGGPGLFHTQRLPGLSVPA